MKNKLASEEMVGGGAKAQELLRRVASRRKSRCELSLISAIGALLRQDWSLPLEPSPRVKLNLGLLYKRAPASGANDDRIQWTIRNLLEHALDLAFYPSTKMANSQRHNHLIKSGWVSFKQ